MRLKLIKTSEIKLNPAFLTLNKTGRFAFSDEAVAQLKIKAGSRINFFIDEDSPNSFFIEVCKDGNVEIKTHSMRVNKKDNITYRYTYFRSVALRKYFTEVFNNESFRALVLDSEIIDGKTLFPLKLDENSKFNKAKN